MLLVTGCAGMIGYHTTRHLLEADREVVGLDLVTGDKGPKLKEWRIDRLLDEDGFTFRRDDVRNSEVLDELFDRHDLDGVVHLAAMAGVRESLEKPLFYHDINATGTLTLLERCRAHDVTDVVIASTSSLYGHHNTVPFREDARTDRPPSPYAASKKAAEAYGSTYSELHGLDVACPRYFTVYGPAGRPDMAVYRFVRWIAEGEPLTIYGDGSQRRDFTYVTDIARGTAACLDVDGFEIVNLGNDDPVTLMELVETIEDHVSRDAEIVHEEGHPADMDATWADISKARKLLDWEPKVPLDEGIERTAAWWDEHRDWAIDVSLE